MLRARSGSSTSFHSGTARFCSSAKLPAKWSASTRVVWKSTMHEPDIVVYPEDGAIDVLTAPEAFETVRDAMEAAGLKPGLAEVTMRADNDIAVEGETAQQVARLLRWLEDLDDVQNVYSNADLGDAAYA